MSSASEVAANVSQARLSSFSLSYATRKRASSATNRILVVISLAYKSDVVAKVGSTPLETGYSTV